MAKWKIIIRNIALVLVAISVVLIITQLTGLTDIKSTFTPAVLGTPYLGNTAVKFPAYSYLPKNYFWDSQHLPLADMPRIISPYRPISGPPRNYSFNTVY